MPEQVIIDTDPAIGYAARDVDDALAIFYLLGNPEDVRVIGVTAVHGNATVKRTWKKAVEILKVAGREDIPVFCGANGRRELGKRTPASLFLSEAARSSKGEVTVLAIGPLTNVASASIIDKNFFSNLKRIVAMGGTFEKGIGIPPVSPFEFNFFKDTRACEMVLRAPCEKIIVTADVCQRAVFTVRELNHIRSINNPVAGYLAVKIEPWLKLNQVMPFLPWKDGFVPWDVIAASYIVNPSFFPEIEEARLRLRPSLIPSGALLETDDDGIFPSKVPRKVDRDRLLLDFLESLERLGSGNA